MPVACRAEHVGWLGTAACGGGGVCPCPLPTTHSPQVAVDGHPAASEQLRQLSHRKTEMLRKHMRRRLAPLRRQRPQGRFPIAMHIVVQPHRYNILRNGAIQIVYT